METFLRNNPGARWTIILLLLFGLLIEVMLITNRLNAASGLGDGPTTVVVVPNGDETSQGGGGDFPPDDPETPVELSCAVVNGVNLRSGPSVNNPIIQTLNEGTALSASARNGDVPWLRVRTADGLEGWVSSIDVDENPLVQCDGELQTLPEQDG